VISLPHFLRYSSQHASPEITGEACEHSKASIFAADEKKMVHESHESTRINAHVLI
jgi:hypothetical protein